MRPKLGLYSITYAGMWYDGPALSVKEVISRAKRFGYDGVELGGRAPHALPFMLTERDRQEILEHLDKEQVELSALAAYNDFSSPVIEHRDANIQMIIALIRLCRDLGAPILRVFTAWRGSSHLNGRGTYEVARPGYAMAFPQTPEMDRWQYCLECLRVVARVAEDEGVTLALQNHPPPVRNHLDCLAMIEEVDSPALKICFDASGEREWQDTGWFLEAGRRLGDRWVHSHFGGAFKRRADGTFEKAQVFRSTSARTDWPNEDAWVQAMLEAGYRGYVNYEGCSPSYLPNGELVPIEVIDERVQMGREYMLHLFSKYDWD